MPVKSRIVEIEVSSEAGVEEFARQLASVPLLGRAIGLNGPLGAGKTTFTRHLVAALGSTDPVSSPSFTLEHEYRIGPRGALVEHWDLYRLTEIPEDLLESQGDSVVRIVEWADKFPELEDMFQIIIAIRFRKIDPRIAPAAGSEDRCIEVFAEPALKLESFFTSLLI